MRPPTGVGNVPVQLRMVTAAGGACVDSSNTLRFVVRPPPEISAAEPLSGFQTGGAQVWVKGIGFAQSNALACRFGDAPAAVEFFGASEVKCTSPKVDADTLAAPIQLTLNGQQWFPPVADAPEFLYSRVPKPERLEPASAPVGVALKIAVSGADLDGGTDYRAFGPLETPAVWSAADGAVLCALPQQADTGALQFALSLNGIDFGGNAARVYAVRAADRRGWSPPPVLSCRRAASCSTAPDLAVAPRTLAASTAPPSPPTSSTTSASRASRR